MISTKVLPLIGISVLLLLFNLPQAEATLCGDTVNVIVKDPQDNVLFSTSGIVPFGDSFGITEDVDVLFTTFCDGTLHWDYSNLDPNNPHQIPEHSFWWTDLMWTDVPGGKVVDFFVVLGALCESPIMSNGFTDTSAHAFVNAFEIPANDFLQCDLKVTSQHPVGGEFIPMSSSSLLLAGAQNSMAWMIPVLVSSIGIAIVIARKF